MFKAKFKFGFFFVISVTLMLLQYGAALAQGNLLITPRRVVFDGTRRVMELNLANSGIDSARYNISIIQYRMNEDGSFTEISEPDSGQFFADKNLRYFPRTVILGPNEAQSVRMQVVNQDKMAPGEYRSHIYFRSVPDVVALGEEKTKIDSSSVSVQLIPIFGITIPVIIRVGDNNTTANLSNLSLINYNDTTNIVEFTINRQGNMSIYGDFKVTYISPSGKETIVGTINGLAVYTPIAKRKVRFELDYDKSVNYKSGKLKITYYSQSDTRPVTYAEAEINLNEL
ncbi:MAG TPA: molecular chaperone [Rikenellaceae bacterium]|nr:molecular chaperone [Rikenellaceae bacterium]